MSKPTMSTEALASDQKALVKEHLQLQHQFLEHTRKHGFNAAEYFNPPAGSFYESYRQRWTELTRLITPLLHPEENQ